MSYYHQQNFNYSDIVQDRHEIRIIVLRKGKSDDPVMCDIKHVSFNESPSYEALSYTWGERTDKVQITLANSKFWVTQNLFLALRQLRSEECDKCLWIDAICINQNNTEEKNNQVQQMARIYQMAKHVHVWLGPENETSKLAMTFLKKINTKVRACIDSGSPLREVHEWIKAAFENPEYDPIWKAIARLWQRNYWSRVWIIQEVVFGTSKQLQCFIHCGKDTIV